MAASMSCVGVVIAHPISGLPEPTIGCSFDRQDTPRDERVYSTVVERHAIFVRKVHTFVYSPPIESLPADAPTWRHAGVTGPAGRDRPQRTRFAGAGRKQPGAQSCADEILPKLNMTNWECQDLLDGGRAGYRYGFAALNLGLEVMATTASCIYERCISSIRHIAQIPSEPVLYPNGTVRRGQKIT
jgi:hypothetical protein